MSEKEIENIVLNNTKNPTLKKRGPGRPPKQPQQAPLAIQGIQLQPQSEENFIEMIYCNPTSFKKIFALYNQYGVENVNIAFGEEGVSVIGLSKKGEVDVQIYFDGNKMNIYYCKEPVVITVPLSPLMSAIKTINATHCSICFRIQEATKRSFLEIQLRDSSVDSYEVFHIKQTEARGPQTYVPISTLNMPMSLEVSAIHLKHKVTTMAGIGEYITFSKMENKQFIMKSVENSSNVVHWNSSYIEPSKIKLSIDDSCIIHANFLVSYIAPIGKLNVGTTFTMYVSNTKLIIKTHTGAKEAPDAIEILVQICANAEKAE